MKVRDALLRMYRVAKLAKKYERAFDPYETPFTDLYGEAADAIYHMIGEDCGLFTESVTDLVLNTGSLDEDRAVELLMNEYRKNESGQPAPCIIDREEMRKQAAKGCGYIAPEGDWT